MQIPKAVQTKTVNMSMLANYISAIIMRGKDLSLQWQITLQSLQQSRSQLNQADVNTEGLSNAISDFTDTLDKLNVQTLQQNVAVAEKSLTNQKLRREIADQRKILEIHKWEIQTQQGAEERTPGEQSFLTLTDIGEERRKLEERLYKVNNAIEIMYEDAFEKENKLENIETLRHDIRIEHEQSIEKLHAACMALDDRKKKLLSLGISDQQAINLSGLYADPNELRRLHQEVNLLKNRQHLIELQIEEQRQGKNFLESNITELMKKQYELECIVRKEKGDDGIFAPKSPPLFKHHDLGGPNMWFVSPIFTTDQQRSFLEQRYGQYASPHSEQSCVVKELKSSPSSEEVLAKSYLKDREEQLVMSYI